MKTLLFFILTWFSVTAHAGDKNNDKNNLGKYGGNSIAKQLEKNNVLALFSWHLSSLPSGFSPGLNLLPTDSELAQQKTEAQTLTCNLSISPLVHSRGRAREDNVEMSSVCDSQQALKKVESLSLAAN